MQIPPVLNETGEFFSQTSADRPLQGDNINISQALSTENLMGLLNDVHGLAIHTSIASNTSSSRNHSLNRMTRNLNMV